MYFKISTYNFLEIFFKATHICLEICKNCENKYRCVRHLPKVITKIDILLRRSLNCPFKKIDRKKYLRQNNLLVQIKFMGFLQLSDLLTFVWFF